MPSSEDKGRSADPNDVQWYDEYYLKEQKGLSAWYRFLLPELKPHLGRDSQLVELGCGQGHLLRYLAASGLLPQENITGVDQSHTAIEFCAKHLPRARLLVDDIYHLERLHTDTYNSCLLMETIEHLEEPAPALAMIRRILKPGGRLYVSFPNFLHLPWLMVRILAEKLNRPNWIVLQPVDKIYTVFSVIRLVESAGFSFLKGVGSNYGPPVLYALERDGITRLLNRIRLWRFSFHPILVFAKQ